MSENGKYSVTVSLIKINGDSRRTTCTLPPTHSQNTVQCKDEENNGNQVFFLTS